jgi:photosystem II stability/assembly factor-like uncharacterized protein
MAMSSSFAIDRPQSRRTVVRWVRLLLVMLLSVVGTLSACNNGTEPSTDGSVTPSASPGTDEPASSECISDPAQAPAEFDTSVDLQSNISSYLMSGQDLEALESALESMCGDLWGFEPEPLIADAMIADVNGDDRDDLLLSVTFPSGGASGEAQVYAYVLGGAGFTPYLMLEIQGASSHASGLYAGGGGEFLDVVDMNHEGPPEIVLAMHWDTYIEYFIANWSEPDVVSLIHYVDELGKVRNDVQVQTGTVTIRDQDGDGLLDLVVEHRGDYGRMQTDIWSWDGAFFSSSEPNTSTTDEGDGPPAAPTWTPIADTIQPLPGRTEIAISSIHMLDPINGWAIGNAGGPIDHIFYTDELGANWQDRTPPEAAGTGNSPGRRAHGFFLDENHAWVIYSPGPLVWRTSDGGSTWSPSAQPSGDDNQIFLNDDYGARLYFSDAQHGWLMALLDAGMSKVYMALYRTVDGGENWEVLIHPTTNPVLQAGQKTGMFFINSRVGWITRDTNGVIDGAFVDWTNDGGQTWETVSIPIPEMPDGVIYYCATHSPVLFSEQSGALGMRCPNIREGSEMSMINYLAVTEDGGRTWELIDYPGGELFFLDRQAVYALDREIHRSEDGGVTWSLVHAVSWDGQFSFANERNIWAVASNAGEIALVHSTDRGQSWRLVRPRVAPR